MLAERMQLNNM